MTARLTRIDDPRSQLDKTRRIDLVRFAKVQGIKEVTEQMPAILIRKIFKDRGIHRVPARLQTLGQLAPGSVAAPETAIPDDAGRSVDAEADLARQFAATAHQAPAVRKTPAQMSINELGAEMKRLNIKRERRDNMISMREKIEAHGQNPS